ncbi:hypothetical protein ACROYT_G040929 [Oculina patagonica]
MAGLQCFGCGQEFGFFRREHGCKKCGRLFCSGCTSNSVILPEHGSKKMKVCDQCYKNITRNVEKDSQTTDSNDMNDLNKDTALLRPSFNSSQKSNTATAGNVTTNILTAASSEYENLSADPDEAIRRRLAELKADDSCTENPPGTTITDQEIGERFENLAGRKATSMQKSNINTFLPKKSEVEEVNDLMKQMLEENKLDEDDPTSVAGVTDKEIEQRLAKLKDIDPSLTNQPKRCEFDSDEDDETASKKYLKQILDEAALEMKTDNIDFGKSDSGNSKPQKPGKSKPTDAKPPSKLSSIFSKDYEANSDDDELPWCCICNGNAVLRCHGCDDDLYCRRCYREGHSQEDYEDHDISEYRPPRKKR